MEEYNTIIIGSGISGMSCAIYLKRAGLSTLIIENNAPGGQLNKAGTIENYPGFTSISGPDLAMSIYSQVQEYDIPYLFEDIIEISYEGKVVSTNTKKYYYQNLVFATGRREKLLDLNHEKEFIGRGISLCATCDGALYRDQDVLVVGGGSSAVSEAIYLSKICRKVYLIYRKSVLRAESILQDRIKKCSNVEVIYDEEIVEYLYDEEKIYGVKVKSERKFLVDGIFLAIGSIPNSELFVGKKQDGYIVVDDKGRTSIENVYACGDVTLKNVYQLITASSEGVQVANHIIQENLSKESSDVNEEGR